MKILILLGAGSSQPSGIPTFRGYGSYGEPESNPYFQFGWWKKDYDAGISFFENMRKNFDVQKNDITLFLEELSKKHDTTFISQNIDALDNRLPKVLKLHGNLYGSKCVNNPFHKTDGSIGQRCMECRAKTIPDVIFYGEKYPKEYLMKLNTLEREKYDILLLVGTSLQITLVETFINKIKRKTERNINFNIGLKMPGYENVESLEELKTLILALL